MVPEILSATDQIIHPFSPLTKQKNLNFEKMKKTPEDLIIFHRCTMTIIWCIVPATWSLTEFFLSFWTVFFPLSSPNNQKIKILINWKKIPADIIIWHKCTKNHDHMLYCSLDMAHNRCNCYFSFWVQFCPFTSLTAPKIKI